MPVHSQFRLLGQRRFLPFYLTQFSGAFNDNLYKNALLLLITYQAGGLMGLSVNVVVNIAAFLFILPFFLFSGIAGQMADRYEKAWIIRRVKAAEIGIMSLAALALWFGWYELLLVLLFLMGAQSTFFGPARITAVAVLVMAVLGYLAARKVPDTRDEAPEVMVRFRPLLETWRLMAVARERPKVLGAILAISWFWFLGAAYLTQFPNFAKTWLAGDETVVTLLLAMFIVGISAGSMLCERLTKHRITLAPVPWGALGLTLLGIDLFFAVPANPEPSTWLSLMTEPVYIRVLLDLVGIGICGGLFIVPLYAFIQYETPDHKRARIIAALNVINSLFMVASAIAGILVLGVFDLGIPTFFLILSLVNALVWVSVLGLRRRAAQSVDN